MAPLLSLAGACRDQPSASRPAARPARSAELTPLQAAYQFLDDLVLAPPPADLPAELRVEYRGGRSLDAIDRAAQVRGQVVINFARDEHSAARYKTSNLPPDGSIEFRVFETPADARTYVDHYVEVVDFAFIQARDRFALPDSRHPAACLTFILTLSTRLAGSGCAVLVDTVVVQVFWLQPGDEPHGTEDQAILLAQRGSAHIAALQAAAARRAATPPARLVLRVGWLTATASTNLGNSSFFPRQHFIQRMSELGYHRGQDFFLDYRFADGQLGRLPGLAAELVVDGVHLLLVEDRGEAIAAKQATTTIPIVAPNSMDPVAEGLAASVTHPGGNLTGVLIQDPPEIYGKRLEILADAFPDLRRVAIVGARFDQPGWDDLVRVARTRGIELTEVTVATAADVDRALGMIASTQVQAVLQFGGLPQDFFDRFGELNQLTLHVPFMSAGSAGVPVVYSGAPEARFRRAADMVDRIRGGAAPAEMPFERPATFRLSVDLRTAREWGLEIAPALVAQADEVRR